MSYLFIDIDYCYGKINAIIVHDKTLNVYIFIVYTPFKNID